MNRRNFLKLGLAALASPWFFDWERAKAADLGIEQPYIYRRFLTFTEYELRPATDMIVIHHTGFPGKDKDSKVEDIHAYHRDANGWAGVGYHYIIRKDGRLEQGRRPMMVGAHAYTYNKNSLGVCLAGNFNLGEPTPEQMETVKKLAAWLCWEYELKPERPGVILGHKDLNDTSCPGKNLYPRLAEIREYAAEMLYRQRERQEK